MNMLNSLKHYEKMIISSKVYDIARYTALEYAPEFSSKLNNFVYFKREDTQPVYSFKIRGAYNKIAHLSHQEKKFGIVCCSAGNHAQGVAMSAAALNLDAKIVMPLATPEIKVRSVRQQGGKFATVVLHGKNYDEAALEAKRLEKVEKRTMILPFDDPHVIAGQATIGMEILQDTTGKPLDCIFVCCGGGGMLAGIATWVKSIRPSVKVIGVEAEDAAGMTESLRRDKVVELDSVGLFADGAAVKKIGTEAFRLCRRNVDEMITVSTDEICAAIKTGFYDTRVILEPAGALAIAGVEKYVEMHGVSGKTFAATLSGANTDFNRLRYVSERADYGETLVSVKIQEKPGAFHQLHEVMYANGATVTEFSYRYADKCSADVYMSFRTAIAVNRKNVLDHLQREYDMMDLTGNELATVHARHMSGGKSPKVCHELLYRFEFPDRKGALRRFLSALGSQWNISLFHYRNHGADVNRVLVGFQVPPNELSKFETFLNALQCYYVDETHNEVYKKFLC